MTSIIIYTKNPTLMHKKGKIKDDDWSPIGRYMWKLHNTFPKHVEPGDRIYFAVNKKIRGYFIIEDVEYPDIIFNCRTWKDIKPIRHTNFQSFKYADKLGLE